MDNDGVDIVLHQLPHAPHTQLQQAVLLLRDTRPRLLSVQNTRPHPTVPGHICPGASSTSPPTETPAGSKGLGWRLQRAGLEGDPEKGHIPALDLGLPIGRDHPLTTCGPPAPASSQREGSSRMRKHKPRPQLNTSKVTRRGRKLRTPGSSTPAPTFPTSSWMVRILLPSPGVVGRALGAPGAEGEHCSSPERLSADQEGEGIVGRRASLPRGPGPPSRSTGSPAEHTWKSSRELGRSSRLRMSRDARHSGSSTTGRSADTSSGRTRL